jgi:hypothetical protein
VVDWGKGVADVGQPQGLLAERLGSDKYNLVHNRERETSSEIGIEGSLINDPDAYQELRRK